MESTFYKWKKLSLLTIIVLLFSGCTFYKNVSIEDTPANIEEQFHYNMLFIIHNKSLSKQYVLTSPQYFKNVLSGTVVNIPEGKTPDLRRTNFPKRTSTAYDPLAVVHILTTNDDFDLGETSISLDDIKSITYHEKAIGVSLLATTALTSGIVVGGFAAFLAIACSCPEITTYNNDFEVHHGSLFPGAMLNSLERDDYLILKNPVLKDDEINIRIANVTSETQYINQLQILEVEHKGFENIAITNENDLVAFNKSVAPISAIENNLEDISNLLAKKDDQNFQFDNRAAKKLNEVVLTFDKSNLSNNPALVIHAQQAKWLDTVATVMLSQAGNYQEKWTQNKDDRMSSDKWKKDNQKRGLSLNAYLKKDDKWEYISTYHDVGTSSKRTLLMPIDLTKINTNNIEIKLESAFKIWEIDYAGLTNSWSTDIISNPLEINTVTNQNGVNILETIASNDKKEVTQQEGDFIEINITANTSNESTLVLHGFGYYHKHSKFDNNINVLFFAKFKQKMGLNDVSKSLYEYMNTVQ